MTTANREVALRAPTGGGALLHRRGNVLEHEAMLLPLATEITATANPTIGPAGPVGARKFFVVTKLDDVDNDSVSFSDPENFVTAWGGLVTDVSMGFLSELLVESTGDAWRIIGQNASVSVSFTSNLRGQRVTLPEAPNKDFEEIRITTSGSGDAEDTALESGGILGARVLLVLDALGDPGDSVNLAVTNIVGDDGGALASLTMDAEGAQLLLEWTSAGKWQVVDSSDCTVTAD